MFSCDCVSEGTGRRARSSPSLSALPTGKLLSVRPSLISRLPGLFALNEHVSYLGEWTHGLMSLTAVGALGVGSVHVHSDPTLTTNTAADNRVRFRSATGAPDIFLPYSERSLSNQASLERGQEMGQFRCGSTVVLVFEAPSRGTDWSVKPGDRVKVGQAIIQVADA